MVTHSGWKIQHPEIHNEGEAWSFDEGGLPFYPASYPESAHTHTHSHNSVAGVQLSKSALGGTGQTFFSPPHTA